jgi:hypothetical protein
VTAREGAGPSEAGPSEAGPDEAGPGVQLQRHFDRLRDTTVPALRFDLAGLPFEAWRDTLRPRLRAALGLTPQAPQGAQEAQEAPAPRLLGAWAGAWRETPHFRWQRVLLRTEGELWVPAYFVVPPPAALDEAGGRVPTVVAVQGHAKDGMRVSLGLLPPEEHARLVGEGDRDLALQAVRHGYACLALEMRGFGELRLPQDLAADAPKSCPRLVSLAEQVGRTLLGMRVHDVLAAIDYLLTRPEVDGQRLVLTGNSGGGAVTLFATALDGRIAASVPSCWFGTYAGSMQLVPHCPCNFVPGLSLLCDVPDLAGLAAPRPQLLVNGRHDANHPLRAAADAWPLTRAIYAAAGAPEAVRWFVGEGGHRYNAAPVWPWLAEALALPPAFGVARYAAAPPDGATEGTARAAAGLR